MDAVPVALEVVFRRRRWCGLGSGGAITKSGSGVVLAPCRILLDKILHGVRPGDLPVEFPTKMLLPVNLQTAKPLTLNVPLSLLVRADEVIE